MEYSKNNVDKSKNKLLKDNEFTSQKKKKEFFLKIN